MSTTKSGILFFIVFVALSAAQRAFEGHGLTTNAVPSIVTALIATVIFVALVRLFNHK